MKSSLTKVMLAPHATKHALDFHEASIITAAPAYSNLHTELIVLFTAPGNFLSKPIFLEWMDLRGHQDMVKA